MTGSTPPTSAPGIPRLSGENLSANRRIAQAVGRVAQEKEVTPAQLALAWTVAQGVVLIPGTRRVRHLEESVAAATITLTPAELAALDEAAPLGAASGDRYPTGQMPLLNH